MSGRVVTFSERGDRCPNPELLERNLFQETYYPYRPKGNQFRNLTITKQTGNRSPQHHFKRKWSEHPRAIAGLESQVYCTLPRFLKQLNKKQSEISPCYWDDQPGGCQNPRCMFWHVKSGRPSINQQNGPWNNPTFRSVTMTVPMPTPVPSINQQNGPWNNPTFRSVDIGAMTISNLTFDSSMDFPVKRGINNNKNANPTYILRPPLPPTPNIEPLILNFDRGFQNFKGFVSGGSSGNPSLPFHYNRPYQQQLKKFPDGHKNEKKNKKKKQSGINLSINNLGIKTLDEIRNETEKRMKIGSATEKKEPVHAKTFGSATEKKEPVHAKTLAEILEGRKRRFGIVNKTEEMKTVVVESNVSKEDETMKPVNLKIVLNKWIGNRHEVVPTIESSGNEESLKMKEKETVSVNSCDSESVAVQALSAMVETKKETSIGIAVNSDDFDDDDTDFLLSDGDDLSASVEDSDMKEDDLLLELDDLIKS